MSLSKEELRQLTERYIQGKVSKTEFDYLVDRMAGGREEVSEIMEEYFNQYLEEESTEEKEDSPKIGLYWRVAAAASLVSLLAIGAWFYIGNVWQDKPMIYQTAYGEQLDVWLQDSSRVSLNAGSELRAGSFENKESREIYFSGEAYFEISRDEMKPFIIHIGEQRVEVLGTAFNIHSYQEEENFELIVAEGSVAVQISTAGGAKEVMTAGQSIIIHKGTGQYELGNTAEVLWKNKVFSYNQSPMKDVLAQLERHYGVELEVVDSTILDLKLSGRFENKNMEDMVSAIAFLAGKENEPRENLLKVKALPMKE